MLSKEFEKLVSESLCPFCKSKLEYYDGALGYEAMKCSDKKNCGFICDHNGYHIERDV